MYVMLFNDHLGRRGLDSSGPNRTSD